MPTKGKSARSKAKTAAACAAAGGTFRKFKPKGKKQVTFCGPKKSKARTTRKAGKKAGKRLKKGDIPAGLVTACKNAKKAGFKGKKKTLRAPCAVVLAA
jgi:hypothetical protein